ncbi:HAD family hydrolase [Deinococcus cellulosilyticus]|uniref:Haloacid dehalogenase n=1 Tax=Deinococcus cellulosilyticus (strain DSM 18568 / NBRC 106333 / KACC 11606 / 5516J-15) TaxID=1223518 RepID=A0A511N6T7_DEIC1|nr:HAD-IA family hydrolase [Deinococcus cellulosilyticus]GEM48131.1 haloacid dehalogenase [Deinococcus cellulosilyticus NBRC 106333 = KACC 11606]
MVQAILWDCDGVLVDSELLCQQGWVDVLQSRGHDVGVPAFVQRFVGHSSHQVLEHLGLPAETHAEVRSRIYALFREHLQASSGVHEVLSELRHLKHAVASNASMMSLNLELELTDLASFFSGHVYSAQDTGKGKPAPDIFLHAARQLGVSPEVCLVIEDSTPGVLAGCAAGMQVLGYAGGSHCTEGHAAQLLQAGAKTVMTDLRELKQLL